MNFLRLGPAGREIPVVQHDGTSYDLRVLTADLDGAFWSADGIARTRAALERGELAELPDAGVLRVGAPVARPNKIVCIGLNYRDHAAETGAPLPAEPVVFMKDPMTLVGPFDDVHIPRGSTQTDWEVELAVVVGTTIRYADSPEQAVRHIAGYAVSHDVSERGFQLERGGQWDKGKSCETFNPLGPWLVPADEVGDPQALSLRLWVNGVLRQDGTTKDMIFPVAHVVWYLSQFMVLYPGDVINTGTPAGVALGLADHPYLRAGDVVELEISGLGRARQTLVAA
ncbi:fumarylacetoacetate hydrolase family protein [Micromonospora orduensis]|uniref:Fumarylacetoacetate hydrolase family protein n=1 Tax=Micromonospora orduensis TaxID=1420891 RepID=A0A5C4QS02_9ACTN|nr:fumarylacetoacetate hydrolase family protein [Micromonospora orduensis]TNH29782.1 fumarylacetoacetate hydrolase family protein [Micromonospora orduensis]